MPDLGKIGPWGAFGFLAGIALSTWVGTDAGGTVFLIFVGVAIFLVMGGLWAALFNKKPKQKKDE